MAVTIFRMKADYPNYDGNDFEGSSPLYGYVVNKLLKVSLHARFACSVANQLLKVSLSAQFAYSIVDRLLKTSLPAQLFPSCTVTEQGQPFTVACGC